MPLIDEVYALGLKDQAELQKELDTMKRETDSKELREGNGMLKQVEQVGLCRRVLPGVLVGVLVAALRKWE
jgi:hypothetical protein